MRRTEHIRIAFFKGDRHEWHHRFIRWWTKSPYSHAEIVLDGETWVSISPFLFTRVAARVRTHVPEDEWDYLSFRITPEEMNALKDFISETTGDGYDWTGMLLSQVLPFIVKGKGKWYCSSWIAHALSHAGIVKWKRLGIYEFPDLHPGKLYEILEQLADMPREDTSDSQIIAG
jgi:hypothetical protein